MRQVPEGHRTEQSMVHPQISDASLAASARGHHIGQMRLIPELTTLDAPLVKFLAANPHAFTRDELLGKWSNWALERAVAHGSAHRILPGVYCGAEHAKLGTVMGEALNLWHTDGLVTGPLALHLYAHELPVPPVAQLHVAHGTRPRTPSWVHARQGEMLYKSGRPNGIQCTTPARALLDAWRFAPVAERRNILWEALWAKVCTWRQLQREVNRMSRIAGRRDLERVLGWFAAGAKSPLEVRAKYEVFADARFREFEWQVDLQLQSRDFTVDMMHPGTAVVVELDGDKYHSSREDRDSDRERQTLLTAAGYAVLRFGWRDIVDRPEWCRRQVLAVLHLHSVRPARTLRMV